MKKIMAFYGFLFILLFLTSFAKIDKNNYVSSSDEITNVNEVIVIINKEYENYSYSIADFSEINCEDIECLTSAYDKSNRNENFRQIYKLKLQTYNKYDLNYAIEKILSREDIYYAEPNYLVKYEDKDITSNTISNISSNSIYPIGNDYDPNKQYGFELCNFPLAWDIATNPYEVKVGVIDTGIDRYHEDLKNMIDIDLCKSVSSNVFNDDPLYDKMGHGTKISSVIAAEANNFVGLVGVAQNVKLVSIRIDTLQNGTDDESRIRAFNYANEIGLKLVNYSFAGSKDYSLAFKQSMANFNGLIVVSAGNDRVNIDEEVCYPISFNLDNVISVGASDENDNIWDAGNGSDGSNYGKNTVDIFAPGKNIYCAIPGSYMIDSGTSLAAPYVTGCAALIWGCYPNRTPQQVKEMICKSVDVVPQLEDYCIYGGRLNARSAITTKPTM